MTFTIDPDLLENNDVRITTDGNGDLAIKHVPTGNTITVDENITVSDIARRQLQQNLDANGNDIQNVESVDVERVDITDTIAESGTTFSVQSWAIDGSLADVTATSYTQVATLSGALPPTDSIPNGTSLEGRFMAQAKITGASAGDQVFVRPTGLDTDGTILDTEWGNLAVSTDQDTFTRLDSGWQSISSPDSTQPANSRFIEAKVDGGTGEFGPLRNNGLLFRLVID